jgi:hypothetical protein
MLAWARAHAVHPKHPLLPIALQRDPQRGRQQTLQPSTADATLAANQGLYNGLLAAGLFWGLFTHNRPFKLFFLACVIVAGVFGAATAVPKIFFTQALPALIAMGLVLALDKPADRRTPITPGLIAATACCARGGRFFMPVQSRPGKPLQAAIQRSAR